MMPKNNINYGFVGHVIKENVFLNAGFGKGPIYEEIFKNMYIREIFKITLD